MKWADIYEERKKLKALYNEEEEDTYNFKKKLDRNRKSIYHRNVEIKKVSSLIHPGGYIKQPPEVKSTSKLLGKQIQQTEQQSSISKRFEIYGKRVDDIKQEKLEL